jgi:hypothetical protein
MIKKSTEFSISVQELLERPDIRNDYEGNEAWMNKMTDEELNQFDKECREMCSESGIPKTYPEMNAAVMSKYIDRGIMYKLLLTEKTKNSSLEIAKAMNLEIYNEKDSYFCIKGINGGASCIYYDKDPFTAIKQHLIQMGRDSLKMELNDLLDITKHN